MAGRPPEVTEIMIPHGGDRRHSQAEVNTIPAWPEVLLRLCTGI
jgi:hypothetical protein